MLYIRTVLLYVYRLRSFGARNGLLSLRHQGLRGEFVFEPYVFELWGKRPMIGKLTEPNTTRDMIPHLENARIVRVRRGLLVMGTEVIARASKSKGERYPQTWVCTQQPIADADWPVPPRDPAKRGFDPADDDADDD